MNYIVLDLEWNHDLNPVQNDVDSRVKFVEIIEIGAVKLDEKFNIVSSFDHYIKPVVYKEISKNIANLINIDVNRLNNAKSFPEVFQKFMEWCGDDVMFCTWGCMDLTELQRNMSYHGIERRFPHPFKFYDVQKLYSIYHGDGKIRKTLETVVTELNIPVRKGFHNALNDAHYTAIVCRKIDFAKVADRYSIDMYVIPETRDQEIHARFDTYEKYISMGYNSKEKIMADEYITKCSCYECNSSCTEIMPWSANCNRIYSSLWKCSKHGYIKGRLKVKIDDNGKHYAIRILKQIDDDRAVAMMDVTKNKIQPVKKEKK